MTSNLANIQPAPNPAGPGNGRAVTHGIHSERVVRPVATVQKRRLLRQIGLRQADLDAVGLGYLDLWSRAQSKIELLDADYAARGFLDRRGNVRPSARFYFQALNVARSNLDALVRHLRERDLGGPAAALAAHLAARTEGGST